ncbi:hypothetical protein CHARACLAT_003359 [Characodon lateralis]|uniref:Uncharacterized protein n=1 Tax=Characodon lateralis TaxID=208331 RepID=A0ABU7E6P1_9TELE|nr:hypothetical protein [Characodon lateralis]
MRLIVAVQEANESEPRVKLLGNHTSANTPKKRHNVTPSTPNKCSCRDTSTDTKRKTRDELLLLLHFSGLGTTSQPCG